MDQGDIVADVPVLVESIGALLAARQPVPHPSEHREIGGANDVAGSLVQVGVDLAERHERIAEVVEDPGVVVEERQHPGVVGEVGGRLGAEDQVVVVEIHPSDVFEQGEVSEELGMARPVLQRIRSVPTTSEA